MGPVVQATRPLLAAEHLSTPHPGDPILRATLASGERVAIAFAALREAANGSRTRDLELGKLALYQLSYRRAAQILGP